MKQRVKASILITTLLAVVPPLFAQVSYRFGDSVPFDIDLVEDRVFELIQSRPGDECRVVFLPFAEYESRYTNQGTAHWAPNPCRIYFNSWYYPPGSYTRFITVLVHELGHAEGLPHNRNRRSIMNTRYRYGQEFLTDDLWRLFVNRLK